MSKIFSGLLDAYHGLPVCMLIPEPVKMWEERMLDDGFFCYNSQVRRYPAFATEMVVSQACINLQSPCSLESNILINTL